MTAQEYGQPRALQHEDEHAQQDEFMEEGNADQDELLEGGNADQDELQEEEDHPEPDELQEEEDAEQNELLEVDHEENQIGEEEEDARPQNGWEAAIQAELKGMIYLQPRTGDWGATSLLVLLCFSGSFSCLAKILF